VGPSRLRQDVLSYVALSVTGFSKVVGLQTSRADQPETVSLVRTIKPIVVRARLNGPAAGYHRVGRRRSEAAVTRVSRSLLGKSDLRFAGFDQLGELAPPRRWLDGTRADVVALVVTLTLLASEPMSTADWLRLGGGPRTPRSARPGDSCPLLS